MNQKFLSLFAIPILVSMVTINILPSNNQSDSTLKTSQDSIKNFETDNLRIHNNIFHSILGNDHLYNVNDSLLSFLDLDLLNQRLNSNYLFQSSLSEQWRINDELTNYIKFNKNLALKSDLGIFGKALGNAKIITTIILAILHVSKYRKNLY